MFSLLKWTWACVRWAFASPAGYPVKTRCARCQRDHIDRGLWTFRAHRVHLCEHCGYQWQLVFRSPDGRRLSGPTRGVDPSFPGPCIDARKKLSAPPT